METPDVMLIIAVAALAACAMSGFVWLGKKQRASQTKFKNLIEAKLKAGNDITPDDARHVAEGLELPESKAKEAVALIFMETTDPDISQRAKELLAGLKL
ncbi:hypothetical protein [Verrucomicrobium spinosum]|nr:hypothetical protein [Verrucomicrobium spinosum]